MEVRESADRKERTGLKEIVLHCQSLFTLLKFSKSSCEQFPDLCFLSFNLSMPFLLFKNLSSVKMSTFMPQATLKKKKKDD